MRFVIFEGRKMLNKDASVPQWYVLGQLINYDGIQF